MAINLIISSIIETIVAIIFYAKENSIQRKRQFIFTIFLWSYNYHLYHILSHKSCPEFCWGRRQPMRWLPALQDLAIYSPTRDDHYHKGVSHRPLVSLFLIYWWCCIHRTPSCANGGVWMADEDVSLHRQCWKYVNTVQLQHVTETYHFPNIIIRQNQYFNQMSFPLLVQIIFF